MFFCEIMLMSYFGLNIFYARLNLSIQLCVTSYNLVE